MFAFNVIIFQYVFKMVDQNYTIFLTIVRTAKSPQDLEQSNVSLDWMA